MARPLILMRDVHLPRLDAMQDGNYRPTFLVGDIFGKEKGKTNKNNMENPWKIQWICWL